MITIHPVFPQANNITLQHVDWPNEFEPEEICTLGEQLVTLFSNYSTTVCHRPSNVKYTPYGTWPCRRHDSVKYVRQPGGRANAIPRTSMSADETIVTGVDFKEEN